MSYLWAAPGVRCVCVNDRGWVDHCEPDVSCPGPVAGERCTITGVHIDPFVGICIKLQGYPMPDNDGYVVYSFRPLTTAERDAELFGDIARHARLDGLAERLNALEDV